MEGGCGCGKVRYRLTDSPLVVHCCHCTWCQRMAGSAFILNAWIETDRVEVLSGSVEDLPMPTPSGGPFHSGCCPECGTTVWGVFAARFFRFVRVGTLDDPGALVPDVHIYTSTKVPWLTLDDGIPAYEGYYRRSEVWRAEALERFHAAKERAT